MTGVVVLDEAWSLSRPAGYRQPKVRGELVVVLGPRPAGYAGLAASDPACTVLVEYPDGELGCVREDDIYEGQS